MAQQTINVGATANDGTGDGIRTAYIKCNDNFKELYDTTITPTTVPNGTSNLSVADSANVTITIAGSANVVNFAGTVSEFTGNISVTKDIAIANSLTVTQDVTIGDQLIINGSFGSNVLPDTNNTRTLGNATLRFASMNTVLINATGNVTTTANISGGNIISTGAHITTGNVTGGNFITAGQVVSTGNVTGGNLITAGRVVATGNVSGLNLVTTGAGNVITSGFFKGDGGFLSNVTAASNVAVTQIANGTTVVGISGSGGNVEITSGGVLTAQTNGTNFDVIKPLTVTGNITTNAAGNISGGNLLTTGRVVSTGNIVSSGNVSGTNFLGNGSFLTGINAAAITNGTSNVTVASGAATTVGVAGTTRLTIAATGTTVDGVMTATGNITATGNVSGGNLVTGGAVIATGAVTGATLAGNGSAITALNGTNIASGTVAAARVATLNQNTTGSAAKLTTTRAIALSGDVVGTANFDGSAGISIATTIQADSVALGTDTTGNYVGNGAVSGNGLSGSLNAEGGTFTVTSNATNSSTGNTIVFRDASGDFNANIITATATTARYADVAEMYLSDQEYVPGTVVTVGGVYEITECGLGNYPVGVVSTDPAYLMNSELTEGLPVALVGRVPVRIFGSVLKGQKVYSDLMGRASKNSEGALVGISLEDNSDPGEKLVECMLKV